MEYNREILTKIVLDSKLFMDDLDEEKGENINFTVDNLQKMNNIDLLISFYQGNLEFSQEEY